MSWVRVSMSIARRVDERKRTDRAVARSSWAFRARSSRLGRRDVALA